MKLYLSYSSEKTSVRVRDELVAVKAFQIIAWVSISADPLSPWESRTPRFPAIVDTGTTHNFALTEKALSAWAGMHAKNLEESGRLRIEGRIASLRSAGLWLHGNSEPFRLSADEGIAVLLGDWPRLPVLGLRALTNSNLQVFVYGDSKRVLIRTPPP